MRNNLVYEKLISFCIPTYERPDELKKVIESILSSDVDRDLYEICVCDDSETFETTILVQQFFYNENIIYKKIDPCSGYENIINALEMGSGKVLKLIDDHCGINKNGMRKMIKIIQENDDDKPLLYFQNGPDEIVCCESFDSFIFKVGYWITHSRNFVMWRKDFEAINDIEYNKMFPHLSLFSTMINSSKFCICTSSFYEEIGLERKGGYNIYNVFGNIFINEMRKWKESKYISEKTFLLLKRQVLDFLIVVSEDIWKKPTLYFEFDKKVSFLKNNYSFGEILIHISKRYFAYFSYMKYKGYNGYINPVDYGQYQTIAENYINNNVFFISKRQIWIYGAGGGGRILLSEMRKNGIKVCGFIDSNAQNINEIDGVSVVEKLEKELDNVLVIISLMRFDAKLYSSIKKKLHRGDYVYLILT